MGRGTERAGSRAALVLSALAAGIGTIGTTARAGTCTEQQQELLAPDPGSGDQLGFAVALSDDTAVVGAYLHDDGATNAGSVYVFVRAGATWSLQQELHASDAAATDRFGESVAVQGDTLLVGAPFHDHGGTDAGAVYVFARSGAAWTQVAELRASDAAAGDVFGAVVALDGDTAVIGAPLADGVGPDSGAAYAFVRVAGTWTQQRKLLRNDPAAMDGFGSTVALSGDTALVGVPSDDDAGTSSGAVYVFVRSGTAWPEQQKLTASDAAAVDTFGDAVAVRGDTALIGAPRDDDGGVDAGSAYVFTRAGTTWTERTKLQPTDVAAGDLFGLSIWLDGDLALLGARRDDDLGAESGSAYLFRGSGASWSQAAKLTATGGAAGDLFGAAVALTGTTALAGAFGDDDGAANAGAAYVFLHATATASETPFNASGAPNPSALLPGQSSPPVVGAVWDPRVDHVSFFPGALADALLLSLDPPIEVPTRYGVLLCAPTPGLPTFVAAAGSPFAIPLPLSCALVGQSVCAQAAGFAPGPRLALTNGLALVIGAP